MLRPKEDCDMQSQQSTPTDLEKSLASPRAAGSDGPPTQARASWGTWLSGLAIITNVQVQARDEQMVGGFFHIKFLKVLAEAAAAATAAALAATKRLGPGLLRAGSRWGDLCVTEKNKKSRPGKKKNSRPGQLPRWLS